MSAVAEKVELVPAQNNAVTPMEMLDRAVSSGASVETLDKLMALQERWEKNQARKSFDLAVAQAKAKIKPVTRNRSGHNSKRYADFSAIAREVDPVLVSVGLSYRFRSDTGDRINVTCILSHKDGHSEETTLSGPPDKTGSKNDIQAIGSTLTYLQRYSLVQMLGLAAADDDDGSKAADKPKITQEQADELRELIEAKGKQRAKFLQWAKIETIEDLPADFYDAAKAAINK